MNSYRDVIDRLRDDLLVADYCADQVLAAIGEPGQAALGRNHTIAASQALTGRDDRLATLIRLFVLQQWQPEGAVRAAVDAQGLVSLGILRPDNGGFRAAVDIRPYADQVDGSSGWVVSDHVASLDTARYQPVPDHVLGVSPASLSLVQITPQRSIGRALDLGTGSGIQSLHLARHADQVVATDVNPRALTLATLTFALNRVEVSTRSGSLYEPVGDDLFDLIVTNPPFVISPDLGPRLIYRETGFASDGMMAAVVSGAGPRLAPGGSLHVVGNWAHAKDISWQERLAGWVPSGCDAFVVEREVLDVYEYIEIWLADAGWAGREEYKQRYEQWLDYFTAHRIEAVGLGWITMVNSGSTNSRVRCEHWPHPVSPLVAEDLMAHLAAMDQASISDESVLGQPWLLATGTVQETTGQPGQSDPSHVVLRRDDGLKRAIEVDTALGGVLGACDGELPLGAIIGAVADLLDADQDALRRELLPKVRDLIAQTWLTPQRPT